MVNVLLVGSGAREHAIAWKLRQSPRLGDLYCAPGNAGTAALATNLEIGTEDIDALAAAAQARAVGLTVVGPEVPLAEGIVDRFQERGLAIYGPTRAAAEIESSKAFCRALLKRHGIPSPEYAVFSSLTEARAYVEDRGAPIVVKADGLAAGKGVTVAQTTEEAVGALGAIFEAGRFGKAGRQVVVEECLRGREVSLHAFVDGETVVPMPSACDYKRVFDGDRGPNTGGMGCYSPPPWLSPAEEAAAHDRVTRPLAKALVAEGRPYRGVLYPGLMVTATGPKVIEVNARLGDPEAEVLLPRLKSDLLDIFEATVAGRLGALKLDWTRSACVCVVMASAGYPAGYATGLPITGIRNVDPDVLVFHAGTVLRRPDEAHFDYREELTPHTSGGRVLNVTALGDDLAAARAKVYRNIAWIDFEGAHYRRDIAQGVDEGARGAGRI